MSHPRNGTQITALVRHDCEVQEGAWIDHTAELTLTLVKRHGQSVWEGQRCDGSAFEKWDEGVR